MLKHLKHAALAVLFGVGALTLSQGAGAQTYPSKPVTLIVAYGPGGASDVFGRALGAKLSDKWGQTVLVDNRPGASTTIAAGVVANAPADGYTLLLAVPPTVTSLYVYDNVTYDKDSFEPISLVATYPFLIVVPKDSEYATLSDLIEAARSGDKKITYASVGMGSSPHLMAEILARQENLDLVHVPYSSGGQVALDLVAGRVDFYAGHPLEVIGQVKGGALRALAILAPERMATVPDIPTSTEEGFPKLQVLGWSAIVAPKGTPQDVVEKISTDIEEVLQDESFTKTFEEQGAVFVGSTPDELAKFLDSEHELYGPLITEIGIKPAGQ